MAKAVNSSEPSQDPSSLRCCRAMIRYLMYPRRLRQNLLARQIWAAAGVAADDTDEVLSKCLVTAVRLSLEHASVRQRTIVERCDLAGETCPTVAKDLCISIRHVYRERAVAHRIIHSRLRDEVTEETIQPAPTLRLAADPVALYLSLANKLEQNGQNIAAIEVLDNLCGELTDVSRRCLAESRLADLYISMDRYSLAEAHIRRAFELCAGRPTEPPWLEAEVNVSAARLAAATGEYKMARDLARRSCIELRSWVPSSREPRITEVLVRALNLSSQIAMSSGRSADALTFTSEASTLLEQLQDPECGARTETHFFAGMAQLIAGTHHRAEVNLWACYELAIGGGQTRDAVAVAALLAGYWRLTDRSEEVIELLSPLMCVARYVGAGDVFGGLLIELGNSAADLQNSSLAQKCLEELNAFRYMSPWIQAHAAMLEARVCLARGHFSAALLASESAESAFVRIGADRLVGPALLIQAESLVKLGERARALRTVEVAITRLRATGEHYRRLIRAYLVMSSLSGDVTLKWRAREIQAQLDRSVPVKAVNGASSNPRVLQIDRKSGSG